MSALFLYVFYWSESVFSVSTVCLYNAGPLVFMLHYHAVDGKTFSKCNLSVVDEIDMAVLAPFLLIDNYFQL